MKTKNIIIIFSTLLIFGCSKNTKKHISDSLFLAVCNYSDSNIVLELNANKIDINCRTAKILQFQKKQFSKLEELGLEVNLYVNEKLIDSKILKQGSEITSYCAYGGYAAGLNIVATPAKGLEIEISTTFCDFDHGDIKFLN